MKKMKTSQIIRQFRKELASLIVIGKINNNTAYTYNGILEKILNGNGYLFRIHSEGHLRRINRVLGLLARICRISRKSALDVTYKIKKGIYSKMLKQAFESLAEYTIAIRKIEHEQQLNNWLTKFCKLPI